MGPTVGVATEEALVPTSVLTTGTESGLEEDEMYSSIDPPHYHHATWWFIMEHKNSSKRTTCSRSYPNPKVAL